MPGCFTALLISPALKLPDNSPGGYVLASAGSGGSRRRSSTGYANALPDAMHPAPDGATRGRRGVAPALFRHQRTYVACRLTPIRTMVYWSSVGRLTGGAGQGKAVSRPQKAIAAASSCFPPPVPLLIFQPHTHTIGTGMGSLFCIPAAAPTRGQILYHPYWIRLCGKCCDFYSLKVLPRYVPHTNRCFGGTWR